MVRTEVDVAPYDRIATAAEPAPDERLPVDRQQISELRWPEAQWRQRARREADSPRPSQSILGLSHFARDNVRHRRVSPHPTSQWIYLGQLDVHNIGAGQLTGLGCRASVNAENRHYECSMNDAVSGFVIFNSRELVYR